MAQSVVTGGGVAGEYGAGWTHTFSGTGGSLEGVQISETVRTVQPHPFNYDIDIQPGPPNVWRLNAAGTMHLPDSYITAPSAVDARMFLPSPPRGGLPRTGTDYQWYHWWCPLCQDWRVFTGPDTIDVVLSQDGNNLLVATAAYGQRVTDNYQGPAVLWDVRLTPQQIIANERDQAQATVSILPQGRAVTWSIAGETLGANINSLTGLVTAGNQVGEITIRALETAWLSSAQGALGLLRDPDREPPGGGE